MHRSVDQTLFILHQITTDASQGTLHMKNKGVRGKRERDKQPVNSENSETAVRRRARRPHDDLMEQKRVHSEKDVGSSTRNT